MKCKAKNKYKICVVIASRANYARIKSLMIAIKENPKFELQIIVGASTLLERFGKAVDVIESDGFKPIRSIHYIVEGETLTTQAKSTGLGIVELATAFEALKPDMVITVADRFETLATAIAASYLNILLAHVQGGEISGNIDDRVRNAITQLADFHFVATKKSRHRVIQMGRPKETVFHTGCPSIDILNKKSLELSEKTQIKINGVGIQIDWNKPFFLIVQHPVTTSYGNGKKQILETLAAAKTFKNYQKIVLWPNADAGSDDVSKGIREFREKNPDAAFAYFKNFSPEAYAKILNNSKCCIGNSSSFIREGSFLGCPVVLVGDRQQGREMGKNCIQSPYKKIKIIESIKKQLKAKKYPKEKIFSKKDAGKTIAKIIAKIASQKK